MERQGVFARGGALFAAACLTLLSCERSASARIVIYTDARGGGALTVRIDDTVRGALTHYVAAGEARCAEEPGTLSVAVRSGEHELRASDSAGRTWRERVTVKRGACTLLRLAPPGVAEAPGVSVADTLLWGAPM
jgi:hypothetical protein